MNDESEEIKIACPHCGQHYDVESSMFGATAECVRCGKSFKSESPSQSQTGTVPMEISVVRRGGRNRFSRKTGILACAVALIAVVVLAGVAVSGGKRTASHEPEEHSDSRARKPSATLSGEEREAIGKIIYAISNAEAGKSKLVLELSQAYDEQSAEILLAVSGCVIANTIVDEDGWSECPRDFQTAIKNLCVAKGKADISAVIEKFGSEKIRSTFDRFNVHDNFRKYFEEVIKEGPSSISRELGRVQSDARKCMEKYGLSSNDIQTLAEREFSNQRMSARGFCKEFVGSKTYFNVVDDHTVTWDVGGETPPFICMATFSDDGTATLVQDNSFFARDYSGTPGATLAQMLEESFPEANPYEREVKNIKAEFRNGHLYFSGEIEVTPGNVEEKVLKVFQSLNKARLRLRFL